MDDVLSVKSTSSYFPFLRFVPPADGFHRQAFEVDQLEDAFSSFNCTKSDDDLVTKQERREREKRK